MSEISNLFCCLSFADRLRTECHPERFIIDNNIVISTVSVVFTSPERGPFPTSSRSVSGLYKHEGEEYHVSGATVGGDRGGVVDRVSGRVYEEVGPFLGSRQ